MGGLLHGDLGYSYVSEKPALQEILPRIPVTALITPRWRSVLDRHGRSLGVISAVKQNTAPSGRSLRVLSLSGLSMPAFWLGLLILTAFRSLYRHPADLQRRTEISSGLAGSMYSVPAAAVGFRSSARSMRFTRSQRSESCARIIFAPPAPRGRRRPSGELSPCTAECDLPVVTVIGIGGVPDWRPDRHRNRVQYSRCRPLLVEAIRWRDYPIVQNLVMLIAHRRGGHEIHGRHALRRDRSTHPIYGLGDSVGRHQLRQ